MARVILNPPPVVDLSPPLPPRGLVPDAGTTNKVPGVKAIRIEKPDDLEALIRGGKNG
jgi:hypothetical protein